MLTQRGRFLTEHFVILKTHVAKQKTHLDKQKTHLDKQKTHVAKQKTHVAKQKTHVAKQKTHVAKPKNTFVQISQEKFQTCSLIDNSQFTQKISFPKIPKTPPVCDLNLDSEGGADAFN